METTMKKKHENHETGTLPTHPHSGYGTQLGHNPWSPIKASRLLD